MFRNSIFLISNWYASKKLHERMFNRILNAPVNLYFDITPIGRILNKLSRDFSVVEDWWPWIFQ